jgi:DNA ligase-1
VKRDAGLVIAAEWGSGRRRGTLSNLHLGARDPERGFVMLGKTFKGLTARDARVADDGVPELEIGRDDYTVYIRPEVVAEIAFNEIQASPQYPGGVALRFAREAVSVGQDSRKADTIATVLGIYRSPPEAAGVGYLSDPDIRQRSDTVSTP